MPAQSRSSTPIVTIHSDRLWIESARAFGCGSRANVAAFLAATFSEPAVASVLIDPVAGRVCVQTHGGQRFDSGLLRRVAAALRDATERLDRAWERWLDPFDAPGIRFSRDDGSVKPDRRSRLDPRSIGPGDLAIRQSPIQSRSELIPERRGLVRVVYLLLAAGSFCLTILAVILPGLPTVPMLLLTSFLLVRSSRKLHQRLVDSQMFGPILRDWEQHRALRPHIKRRTIGAMVIITVLTYSFAELTAPVLIAAVTVVVPSYWFVFRLPTIPAEPEEQTTGRAAGPALVA